MMMNEEKKTSQRTNLVGCIVGGRGTGKTTYLKGNSAVGVKGLLQSYQVKYPNQKILILDTFDNPMWRDVPTITYPELADWNKQGVGMRRIYDSNTQRMLLQISRLYNTVMVFEDATKIFRQGRLDDITAQGIIDSKQKNTDIYFVFHWLGAVPPGLSRLVDVLTLFKTNERWNSVLQDKWPNPVIEEMFMKVKEAPGKYHYEEIDNRG